MNITNKITCALAALTIATAAVAHTPATAEASTGLLGQRYAEASASIINPHGRADDIYGVDFGVNLPVANKIDLGFNFGNSWLSARGASVDSYTLSSTVAAYTNYKGVKPFAGVGIGHQWSKTKFRGVTVKDEDFIWGVTVGVEVPVAQLTFTPRISYADTFQNNSTGAYSYGVEVNTWVTKTVAIYADLAFIDGSGNSGQAWNYELGARFRF